MKKVFAVIVILSVILNGCNEMIDIEKEKESLINTDREFAEYSKEHGAAEAFNRYLLPDAFQLPNRREPIFGRDNIYQLMLPDTGYQLLWVPQSADVSSAGDLGYSWGIYTYIFENESGDTVKSTGKYLNVWKKDEQGDWRVLIDMGNSNPL